MSLVGIETRQTCTRSRHPSVLCRAIRSHPISQQVCEIQKVQEDSAPRATQSTERGNFSWHVCEITKVRKEAPLQSTYKVWVINSHIHQSVLFRAEGIWRLYASSRDWRSPNHKELKHTFYLSFFLHRQNFWRIKFTPKKRVNYDKIYSKLPIFCVITSKYTVNCQFFALNL